MGEVDRIGQRGPADIDATKLERAAAQIAQLEVPAVGGSESDVPEQRRICAGVAKGCVAQVEQVPEGSVGIGRTCVVIGVAFGRQLPPLPVDFGGRAAEDAASLGQRHANDVACPEVA